MITDDVLTALRQITQAIDLHSRQLIKMHGITGPQLIILKLVQRQEPIAISGIAKGTSLKVSTVTGILSRLEKRGLITRARSATDKRRVLVELTADGKTFLDAAPQPLQDKFLKEFDRLESWEQLMILSALQRLVRLMQAEDIDVSPILATGPIQQDDH